MRARNRVAEEPGFIHNPQSREEPMRTFAIGASLLLFAGALAFGGSGGTDPIDPPPPPVNTEFAGVLLRLGLGADALAAAGVTAEQVPALVSAVEGSYSAPTLQARDDAYIAARQSHDRLRRLVQSGKGTEADVQALARAHARNASKSSHSLQIPTPRGPYRSYRRSVGRVQRPTIERQAMCRRRSASVATRGRRRRTWMRDRRSARPMDLAPNPSRRPTSTKLSPSSRCRRRLLDVDRRLRVGDLQVPSS